RSKPETWGALEFAPLGSGAYPAYDAVRSAAAAGGNRGVILNAADEMAVAAFLDGRIGFPVIGETIERAVERWGDASEPELAEIGELDAEVRSALQGELA